MDLERLTTSIKGNEGFKGMPYKDTRGFWTVGYGTKLPLSKEEAELLLKHRLDNTIQEIIANKPFFVELPETIQEVLAEMGYQLGVTKQMKFGRMWEAVENEDWNGMIREMYDSKWYHQTPHRVEKLVAKLKKWLATR
jgi:lysozyme